MFSFLLGCVVDIHHNSSFYFTVISVVRQIQKPVPDFGALWWPWVCLILFPLTSPEASVEGVLPWEWYPSLYPSADKAFHYLSQHKHWFSIKFLGAHFFLTSNYFLNFSPFPICCFSLVIRLRAISNHMTESILGRHETSSAKEVSPFLFHLALGKFLGHEQEAPTLSQHCDISKKNHNRL